MIDDKSDRLLMSEELQGMVPELEDDAFSKYEDTLIVAGLEAYIDNEPFVFSAALVGFAIEAQAVKLDCRTDISTAYSFLKSMHRRIDCKRCYLHYMTDETIIEGPFVISNPKVMDFDREQRTCTLGIDLVRT